MRKKLGRKGIKLRNRLIFMSILMILIFLANIILKYQSQLIEKEKYAKQTESLIKAKNNIAENSLGATYYISADGTSADGTDIKNPMSLENAKKKTYNGNDTILFKSGDTFYGSISFNVRTVEDSYIYISSYGDGEKPIISGANILINFDAWILDEEGVYKLDLSDYNNFEGIGINDNTNNIGFIADEQGNIYGNRVKTKELLKNTYDFYCKENYLYIKCLENPSKKLGKIKLVSNNHLVWISSNTIFENINIQYTGGHGIVRKNPELNNVYIKDCIIQNIGGSVQIESSFTRYGNGIEFYHIASNTIVEGCIFRNIYDAAYTIQGKNVTTGFENNICRNNIFINSTYTYETWCSNQSDEKIDIKLKGQQFINNISINQSGGWGYAVRPEKTAPAEFVVFSFPPNNTDITIKNNKYFNSRMLVFKSEKNGITLDSYSRCVKSDNNVFYMNEKTLLMNSLGSYMDRTILDEYGIEQNSEFKLLTDDEINKISNKEILNSNDYNEIKNYYETLEKDFSYEDNIEPIKEKYTQFKQQNKSVISQTQGLSTQIEKLETNLQQTNSTNGTQTGLTNLIKQNYELGNTILDSYLNNKLNVTEDELITILQQINEIGQVYNGLYNLLQSQETVDFTQTQSKINEYKNEIKKYNQMDLTNVAILVDNCNTIIQSDSKDTLKNISTSYVLNWVEKLLDIDVINYINQNPPAITYSNTSLTNQNVIATVTADYEIKVTNNNKSPTYIFQKNDRFTFQYTIRNKPYQITAAVYNVDKIPPTIKGVENGKIYTTSVTPIIEDPNLQTITLKTYGQEDKNYTKNTAIVEEGEYNLTAIDKAGNETTINFIISYPEEEKYQIENNTIKNINGGTKISALKEKLQVSQEYKIKRNDRELNETDNISTGDILETTSGEKYTLIVKGDINKDGDVTIKDIVRLRKYLLGNAELGDIEKIAADANLDGKEIGIKDLVRMRILALKREN